MDSVAYVFPGICNIFTTHIIKIIFSWVLLQDGEPYDFWSIFFLPDIPIDSWLDLGTNMDQMTGREKIFYKDQQFSRECHLSEEVDEEFEKEKQPQFEEEMEIEEQLVLESTFINEEETAGDT